MTSHHTVPTTSATRHPPSAAVAGLAPVFAAVWCCSVGTSWTLELHHLHRGTPPLTLVDWITSGVPISQPPPPEALARELLASRGLHLFCDPAVVPCTGSRRGIGYVTIDANTVNNTETPWK
jgi:hypothetical protein